MLKTLFAFLLPLFAVLSAQAQTKPVQTVKISTPTVQCEMCKTKIENTLKRYDGIITVNVNYKKKETVVKYYTDRINDEFIKTAIVNIGYDANEQEANPESYKGLPKCCKKPEDRGVKPKDKQ
jgi:periplasmic mercuric ion binding protein